MPFCEVCKNLTVKLVENPLGKGKPHLPNRGLIAVLYLSRDELSISAARTSCRLCADISFIWDQYERGAVEHVSYETLEEPMHEYSHHRNVWLLFTSRYMESDLGGIGELDIADMYRTDVLLGIGRQYIRAFRVREVVGDIYPVDGMSLVDGTVVGDTTTGSTHALGMIRSWLDLCTRAHQPACAADLLIGARDIRPTRLLEVSAARNMGSGCVRVVNSCSIPGAIEYATLSHRWHKNLTIPTLLENGMWTPLTMLDRLFAEAAVTAQSLGQSYLWIDALCIDQGSSEDKAREIALMGQYYGNAAFNIVAASDLRPSEKLWRIRPRHVRPFKVRIRLSEPTQIGPLESSIDSRELSVKSFLLTLSPILHRGLPTDTGSVEERLDSRGWVLQERALARRSIFFGDTCVWFSCACLAASENHPEGYNEKKTKLAQVTWESEGIDLEIGMHFASSLTLDMIGRVIRVIWNLDRFKQLNFEGARPDLLHLWYGLLQDYWKRNLTYDSDFIVALSGIAFSMSKGLNSDYIAGLWKDDIIWGLGWRVRRDRLTRPNVTSCAPSWSWASMDVCGSDRQITMHKFLKPHRPLITNIQVTWSLVNPKNHFGDVCDAKLEARGYLHPIDCTCSTSQTTCDTVDEPNSFHYDIHWDLPPSCADHRGSHKLLVLPLYVHIELMVIALALESVSENVFRRVGIVDMRNRWIDYFEECPIELTRVVVL